MARAPRVPCPTISPYHLGAAGSMLPAAAGVRCSAQERSKGALNPSGETPTLIQPHAVPRAVPVPVANTVIEACTRNVPANPPFGSNS